MSSRQLDPVFALALRERLVKMVEDSPRARRRWRWRMGLGVLAGSTALAGGAAIAAGVFSPPGAPQDTPLGNIVTVTRTGTATIDLGPAPTRATNISLTLTCLTVGNFGYPDGSSISCSAADLAHPPPIARTGSEVVPLVPGEQTVTITTSANASWTLQADYINRVITAWGTNANGETYGVPNKSGTPDLIATVFDDGKQHGYVKSSDLACASGQSEVHSPAQALAWNAASKARDVSVPIYDSDGATVIGSLMTGGASGPDPRTVSVSSLYPECGLSEDGGHSPSNPLPPPSGSDEVPTTTVSVSPTTS